MLIALNILGYAVFLTVGVWVGWQACQARWQSDNPPYEGVHRRKVQPWDK